MKKLLVIMGTRPEVIKLAPVILEFKKQKKLFKMKVVVTAQHREMLDDALSIFDIVADYDLNLMKSNQGLDQLSANILKNLENIIKIESPNAIIVQGDTTTAFIAALISYYHKRIIAHVEAGLRTYNKYNPFPEEINRHLISVIADINFAPTVKARENLLAEGISKKNIWVTGNTIVDALFYILKTKRGFENRHLRNFDFAGKKVILVTAHRRESFGAPLRNICLALKKIAKENPDVEIFYPVHPNPNVRRAVFSTIKNTRSVHLIEPLSYPDFINLMARSSLVLTDSGGVQEEAPSLGKPVLVMRGATERPEIIESGLGVMVGSDREKIVRETNRLIKRKSLKVSIKSNPYGDGKASQRIVRILKDKLKVK